MTDTRNPNFERLYLRFDQKASYNLHGDAFSPEITTSIQQMTGLQKSDLLGDWWTFKDSNPILPWEELLTFALSILHREATRLFVTNLYLENLPIYTSRPVATQDLILHVRGSRRTHAHCGLYREWNPNTQTIGEWIDTHGAFRLSGKDEFCQVEGTWFDWCCFACNILASENTLKMSPELYESRLENDNY